MKLSELEKDIIRTLREDYKEIYSVPWADPVLLVRKKNLFFSNTDDNRGDAFFSWRRFEQSVLSSGSADETVVQLEKSIKAIKRKLRLRYHKPCS